jgi:ABC-2 type transport system permease protein
MIWRIATHELRSAWRSRVIAALAVALTLLAASAAMVGQARFAADNQQRARYQQMVGEQFESQPDRHPHRVSHYGFLVFRPRAPLGFFDSGVESYGGTSIFLEAHKQNTANFSAAAQAGSNERFGELTLALVLQVFVPLFIFGVAGVSVTREREAGTLPLLLCQGAPWSTLLWGKLWGALLMVGVVLAPALTVSLGWLALQSGTDWTIDLMLRAAGLAAVHGMFLVVCAAIAVTVSAWQRSSRSALITLLGAWIVLWIVLPRVLPAVGAALYPAPSRAAFEAQVERAVKELGDSHNPNDPKFAALRAKALAEHKVTRVEDLPFNYSGFVMQQGEQMTSDAYQAHLAALLDTYARQSRLVDLAAVFSPFLGVRSLSMALAGADVAHLVEFDRQAEAFRFSLIASLNDLHMNEVPAARDGDAADPRFGVPSRLRLDQRFFDHLPAFAYQPPPVAWALSAHRLGMAAVGLSVALVLGALFWTSRQRALAL